MSAERTRDYPLMIARPDHVEPVPRRVRATLAGVPVLDTTSARYVWEWPNYPWFYVPLADVRTELLVPEERRERFARGTAVRHGLRVGERECADCAWVYGADAVRGLVDTVRFDWTALEHWFEEDEEVFVHPRNPYTRVDAVRSSRTVRVELDGVPLAESPAPVMLFETGLPTRYYLDRGCVDERYLVPSNTETACPYKGRTTGYWSVQLGDTTYPDLAWTYHFPTTPVLAIAGLVAFYNEQVDIFVDDRPLPRPVTHFFNPRTD